MATSRKKKTALSVTEGVPQPDPVSGEAVEHLRARKKQHTPEELFEGIMKGEITLLSKAITLAESAHPEHQSDARELITSCLPYSGKAFRVGITGVPGAGKSTFIESLGMHIISRGGRLAVLAIDPSSERSGGSILGDKTRMEKLASRKEAYIRPSPAGGTLGGVARKTRETIILCEAAGFDHIIVETVGVGQSETAVHGMVDFFLLIALAGAGDELQGIKRGIMELADGIAINKADGTNLQHAERARTAYTSALHLFPPAPSGLTPQVRTCSALFGEGIKEIWEMAESYLHRVKRNGYLQERRREQSRYWMFESVREGIFRQLLDDPQMKKELERYEKEIEEGRITSFMAAAAILDRFR